MTVKLNHDDEAPEARGNARLPSILVIDDDEAIGDLVLDTAGTLGFACRTSTSTNAIADLLTPSTTLILLDLVMPNVDGIEMLRSLAARGCQANIVLMSGTGQRMVRAAEDLARALGLNVVGSLHKPFRLAALQEALKREFTLQEPVRAGAKAIRTLSIEEMHQALRGEQIVLHYQPKIEIATGKVIGLEALARWQHPVLGLIYPDEFISRMEEVKLMDELGWVVARLAFAALHRFADESGSLPNLCLNVPVSTLQHLKFPDRLEQLAGEYNIPPGGIVLEITESGLIQELASSLDVLTRLRLKNFQLSIDDFGTGYSMMQQLRHMPATELKIDRGFVQNMHTNAGDRVLVEKTIEIGHQLGMKVVAEGVETHAQLDFLRARECDIAQGYLFSKPLPAANMVDWLRAYAGQRAMAE